MFQIHLPRGISKMVMCGFKDLARVYATQASLCKCKDFLRLSRNGSALFHKGWRMLSSLDKGKNPLAFIRELRAKGGNLSKDSDATKTAGKHVVEK